MGVPTGWHLSPQDTLLRHPCKRPSVRGSISLFYGYKWGFEPLTMVYQYSKMIEMELEVLWLGVQGSKVSQIGGYVSEQADLLKNTVPPWDTHEWLLPIRRPVSDKNQPLSQLAPSKMASKKDGMKQWHSTTAKLKKADLDAITLSFPSMTLISDFCNLCYQRLFVFCYLLLWEHV